jgi:diguanylate cyclase (GGDEF)-like protein
MGPKLGSTFTYCGNASPGKASHSSAMNIPARAFSLRQYPLALLVVLTIALIFWHQVGMDRALVLDAAGGRLIEAHSDSTEGGKSAAVLSRKGKSVILDCRIDKSYAWPFCEVAISLARMPQGVDLSDFDSITFKIRYTGPGSHAVRFYLRNFEAGMSDPDNTRTLKVNEIEFPVPDSAPINIPMKFMRVASWWTSGMNIPLFRTDMRIDNVSFVELSTGSSVEAGQHRIEIESITFHGKWISKTSLLMALIGGWLVFGVSWLVLALLHFRARLQASRSHLIHLRSLNQALQLETKELAGQARTDPLTGALNREGLRDYLMNQWQVGTPHEPVLTIIFADLDHFKKINDGYGHSVGDDVLQQFVRLVQGEIRASDRLARWGGEEFLIVCPKTEIHQGCALAEKLRATVAGNSWPQGLRASCSFGVAAYAAGEDFSDTIKRADQALYQAKGNGRNRVETV